MSQYSWVPVFQAIANELPKYEHNQKQLIQWLRDIGMENGLTDQTDDAEIELEEIDPFSFFSMFMKYEGERRTAYFEKIIDKFGLDLEAPDDFSGVPSAQGVKVWLFPYKKERNSDDIPTLWKLFNEALNNQVEAETFESVLKIKNVGFPRITQCLFYCFPQQYLPIDKQTRPYLEKHHIDIPHAYWENYMFCLKNIQSNFSEPFYELSYEAWNENNSVKSVINDGKYKELCLIGTWRHASDDVEDIQNIINDKGGWASWWSFVISNEVQKVLKTPFYFYSNEGGGSFTVRFLVDEYVTSRGNEGILSPWQDLTDASSRGKKTFSNKKSDIFKTWFKVIRIEKLDKSLTLEDFEPAVPFSNKTNLLNQNAFGFAYIKSSVNEQIQNSDFEQKKIIPVGDNASKKDLLGRSPLVHVIAGIIEKIDSTDFRPFVIALLGKWGSGKSTVINLIQEKLKQNKNYKFLMFNAWQNEHCNNIGAALANSIVGQLFESRNIFFRMWMSLKFHMIKEFAWLKIIFVISLLLLFPVIIWFDVGMANELKENKYLSLFGNENAGYFLSFMSALGLSVYTYLKNPFTVRVRALVTKPDYSEHLGISNYIKNDLSALIDSDSLPVISLNRRKQQKQYIIVVDDLDRCSDEKIFQVLEAIRLIIDLPNVMVILAVDQDILLSAVANRFSKQNKHLKWPDALKLGRDFLGKIIQLSIELDTPNSSSMKKFIAERLYVKRADINVISNNIKSSKKTSESESFYLELSEEDTPSDFLSEHNTLELEEEYVDYKESNEYLESTSNEIEVFSSSVGAFDISNPRTLVRIHNTITLLKGVYPEIIEIPKQLKKYIFFAFFHEVYSSSDTNIKNQLEAIFNSEDITSLEIKRIENFANEIDIVSCNKLEKGKIYSRIKKYSLPSISILTDRSV